MKILYDHQIFTEQRYGGISRYFKYLIDGIKTRPDMTYELGLLRTNNYYVQHERQLLKSGIFNPFIKSNRKLKKRNNSYCEYLVNKSNFSVLHPSYYDPYLLKYLKKPLVITVHDMTHEALPHLFPSTDPTSHFKRIMMERADKIIAISEHTKQDILKYTNIGENKIEVILHGLQTGLPVYGDIPNLPEKYILFVGSRWSYKNFHLAATAFKKLNKAFPDLKFVIAGGEKLAYGDTEFLMRNEILDQTFQFFPSDEQLNTLYNKAVCFVYPSLYEGFGFPILEAFKNSCPVILSDCSCFPEIARDAALYFNPTSIDSLSSQIIALIESKEETSQLISKGLKRLSAFPIDKCVNKTIELYKSLG